ncbi:MAG: biotin transporter BioY, partial [Spirochaetales bacterium]|nr:biotin transporter BioY [Candidatus Physcosoma equi]
MIMLTALFTALVAAGAFIRIPMVPVPVTLQTLFVFMAGLLLPVQYSAASIALYMFLGAVGLPIFTSGGGLAALLSPTGGFIFGFLLAVIVGSLMAKKKHDSFLYNVLIMLVMEVITYAIGLPWLKVKIHATWAKTFSVGLTPFILGDTLKMLVAAGASRIL